MKPDTFDITPTWENLLPAMLEMIKDNTIVEINNLNRKTLKAEFLKMAQAADKWNAHVKEKQRPKLGERNYTILAQGCIITGNAIEAYHYCEEQLYTTQAATIYAFMKWVDQDQKQRGFGSENYEERFSEFLESHPEYKSQWK